MSDSEQLSRCVQMERDAQEERRRKDESVRIQNEVDAALLSLGRDIALSADDALYCLDQKEPNLEVVKKRLQSILDRTSKYK